jgi:phosphatidate cytidylyltransferase
MADETTALWMQAFSWLGLGYVIYRALFVDNGPTFEDDPSPARNHLLRLTTAAFYVPFVIVSAVYVPNVIHIFMTIMVTKGLGEFIECLIPARASKEEGAKKKYKFSRMDRLVQLLGGLQVVLCHFLSELGLSLGLALAFVIILCFFLFKTVQEGHNPLPPNTVRNLAFYLFGWVWIAWTISHCPAIYHTSPYGGSMLAMLLLTGWIGDGAAYYVGKNFGRHKAMPNVSPNKSWEGIIAEIVFAVLLCYGFKQMQLSGVTDKLPPYDTIHYIGLALLTSCLGIFGDAIESLIKRMGNIKDSGVFFPGHGGILDRFDAFFVSGPFIYHYLIHVVGAGHL